MKTKISILVLIFFGLFAFMSCEKDEQISYPLIEGTYIGTLVYSPDLKTVASADHDGTAVVTIIDELLIEVHCFGGELDTSFILSYYEHNDSILTCLTGETFENIYGHMPGQGHMTGGMMDDIINNQSEWMHHLNDEHQEDDEHYGGFYMRNHSFIYSINMENGYYHFDGKKQ